MKNSKISRVDIKIGFRCNNHCKFCIQGNKRDIIPVKPEEEIQENLKQSFHQGVREVVFTGGEPTLHPNLLNLIRFTEGLGYKQIQIQTNGRLFAYLNFCKEVIAAGANEFGVSLHGHLAKTHDFLTSVPGSFNQVIQGIKNLKSLNQKIITNTVITTKNYKYLPEIAKLLIRLRVDQFQFAFIHIGGTVWENQSWIIPRKKDVIPYVKKGLEIGIKAGKKVMVEAIPPCLMEGYESYVSDVYIPRIRSYDAGYVIKDHTKYRLDEGKIKHPNCRKCCYFNTCEGPWREYPEIFGWDEFKPVN